jgi:thiol-disulfide isomerase/thioredoxin
MKGKSVSLADFKGQVVFLDFWATWCPPCRASLPEVERLFSDYQGKNLQVLGMNLDEDAADVVSFVAKKKVLYPVLLAGASDVSDRYGVGGIPHFVLIDREGRRVDQWSGFAPGVAREWRKAIDALLAAPAPKPSSTPNASPS